MTKILHISTYKIGGAGNAAYRLHLALKEDEHHSSRFLYRGELENLNDEEATISPKNHLIHHRIANKIGLPLLAWHKNRKIIDSFKGTYEKISFPLNDFNIENHPWVKDADIIHLHWIADFINYPTFFDAIKHKPIVWTLHDMNAFKGLFHYQEDETRNQTVCSEIDQKIKEDKANSILKAQNLNVVCPSQWLADIAKKSVLFKDKDIKVIPYSLPETWFNLRDDKKAQEKFQLHPRLTTLLFVALDIDTKRKGLDLLLAALKSIPENTIQLLIIGNKDFDFGQHSIVKTGYISNEEDMVWAYAAADVFILPSREDNLPNVMLEAFAQGRPVISFKNGGMKDWIINGFNGYLCENIHAESLSSEINKFLTNKELFSRSAINQFAIKNFHPTLQAKAYQVIYDKLMNN